MNAMRILALTLFWLAAPNSRASGMMPLNLMDIYPDVSVNGLSDLCHILLFYGVNEDASGGLVTSGRLALDILTDEELARKRFGSSPFVRTRHGLRYLLSSESLAGNRGVGEVHRDQCLATFAVLGLSIDTPIKLAKGQFTISDLVSECKASFTLQQAEPAWSVIALCTYGKRSTSWKNKLGEQLTFSSIARSLIQRGYDRQSCGGVHILEALIHLHRSDQNTAILDADAKLAVAAALRNAGEALVNSQASNGAWQSHWWRGKVTNAEPDEEVLVTGQLLELTAIGLTLPEEVRQRAGDFIRQAVLNQGIRYHSSRLCPLVHAVRAVRIMDGDNDPRNPPSGVGKRSTLNQERKS